MTPTVSVAIKAYNHAPFVARTISSVLEQPFQDFEIVVTDDASTDGTAAVLRGFSDPRIRLEISPENRGIAAAMNATIARCRGEFIAILNSDDYALPGRFATQADFLRANTDVAAVFGLPRMIDERGAPANFPVSFRHPFSLPDFAATTWLRSFFVDGNALCAPTAMVRRSAYLSAGPYDQRLASVPDLDMWVRLCAHGRLHLLDQEVTAFRIRDGHRNAGAPRADTLLRSSFEHSRILHRFRALPRNLLDAAFAADRARLRLPEDGAPEQWLAEIALQVGTPAHRLFALEALFETAYSRADLRRLSVLAGSVDLFGQLRPPR